MAETITRNELKTKIDRDADFKLVEALPALPNKSAEIVVYCAGPT